jgi:hypothetical protein
MSIVASNQPPPGKTGLLVTERARITSLSKSRISDLSKNVGVTVVRSRSADSNIVPT